METLYNWLFHYNPFNKTWNAFNIEDFVPYRNGMETKYRVLKSDKIETLIYIITQVEGDLTKIDTKLEKLIRSN